MEKDILRFDPSCGTIVETEYKGELLKYISYMHIQYVADPVDPDYQSLDIYAPVSYGNIVFDYQNAPIVFQNRVSGYDSNKNRGEKERRMVRHGEPPVSLCPPRIGPAPGMEARGVRGAGPNTAMEIILSAGLVLVIPGSRGRDCISDDGRRFGKAPATIVDLKAALRYLRYNKDVIPGNTDYIISRGASAGGAMSALLSCSGNSPDYEPYLQEIGAANERDDVFAGVVSSPVLDLEHEDMAYEWQYGKLPINQFSTAERPPVDQVISKQLASLYPDYLRSLNLKCTGGYGQLTTDNYNDYYLSEFVIPAAQRWLQQQDDETRRVYLEDRTWIKWDGSKVSFSFEDYEIYLGRLKGLPAFDNFSIGKSENSAFGTEYEEGAHMSDFSLQYTSKDPNAKVTGLVLKQRELMNPMVHLYREDGSIADHWRIRMGAKETGFACPLCVNMALKVENLGMNVDFRLIWDGGHCAEDDYEGLINWIYHITGYQV